MSKRAAVNLLQAVNRQAKFVLPNPRMRGGSLEPEKNVRRKGSVAEAEAAAAAAKLSF